MPLTHLPLRGRDGTHLLCVALPTQQQLVLGTACCHRQHYSHYSKRPVPVLGSSSFALSRQALAVCTCVRVYTGVPVYACEAVHACRAAACVCVGLKHAPPTIHAPPVGARGPARDDSTACAAQPPGRGTERSIITAGSTRYSCARSQ